MENFVRFLVFAFPSVVALTYLIICIVKKDKNIDEGIFVFLMSFVVTIGYNAVLACLFALPTEKILDMPLEKHTLVSAKFDENIEGGFFLGIGNVGNKEYLQFSIREGNELKREKVENYKINITEKDMYIELKKEKKMYIYDSWLYDLHFTDESDKIKEAILYIPEDYIIPTININ